MVTLPVRSDRSIQFEFVRLVLRGRRYTDSAPTTPRPYYYRGVWDVPFDDNGEHSIIGGQLREIYACGQQGGNDISPSGDKE